MRADPELLRQLRSAAPFDAQLCMNCGTCTALCPIGIDVLPRQLFHEVLLGNREALRLQETAIFSCLLCKLCEANCPSQVHITDNIRSLRTYLNREVHALAEA
jgi:heterodisulfide reductase subunit C